MQHGAVTKISTLIPRLQEEYDVVGTCSLCLKPIHSVSYQLNKENFMVIAVSYFGEQFLLTFKL